MRSNDVDAMEKEMFSYGIQVDMPALVNRVVKTEEILQQVNKRMHGSFVPYPDPREKAIHAEVVQLVAAYSRQFQDKMVKTISAQVAARLPNNSVKIPNECVETRKEIEGCVREDTNWLLMDGLEGGVPPQFR